MSRNSKDSQSRLLAVWPYTCPVASSRPLPTLVQPSEMFFLLLILA